MWLMRGVTTASAARSEAALNVTRASCTKRKRRGSFMRRLLSPKHADAKQSEFLQKSVPPVGGPVSDRPRRVGDAPSRYLGLSLRPIRSIHRGDGLALFHFGVQ